MKLRPDGTFLWVEAHVRKQASEEGAAISQSNFDPEQWYPIKHMPATVLDILRKTVFIRISISE